jgi:hypothetical protein
VIFDSLAETKGDLEAPLEFDGAVEGLQGGHARVTRAPARVAELQHRQQSRPAVVVVVAHVQRQVARALEAEAAHGALGACNNTTGPFAKHGLFSQIVTDAKGVHGTIHVTLNVTLSTYTIRLTWQATRRTMTQKSRKRHKFLYRQKDKFILYKTH